MSASRRLRGLGPAPPLRAGRARVPLSALPHLPRPRGAARRSSTPSPLWSARRRALARFRRADFLGDPDRPLDAVRPRRGRGRDRRAPRRPGPAAGRPPLPRPRLQPGQLLLLLRPPANGSKRSSPTSTTFPGGNVMHMFWREERRRASPDATSSTRELHVSPADGDGPDLRLPRLRTRRALSVHIESRPRAPARRAGPSTPPSTCAAASSAAATMARLLARYPAMSLQVVARIYGQALRLKLKGARYLPPPAGGTAEGVPSP